MELRGAAIIVTGASRGLGAALAEGLGRAGARLVLISREREALEAVVEKVRRRAERRTRSSPTSARVNRPRASPGPPAPWSVRSRWSSTTPGTLGPVPLAPLADTSDEDFEQALATNLVGPFRLTRALVGSMALRGRGTVVLVSSDAATTPYPRWGAYGVSKAALEHLGRIWNTELSDTGIRFLIVDPGEMDTRMHREAVPEADPATLLPPEQAAARVVQLLREAP
jgi:NAD(P)-dependent dehydrogenase (short-subunit alcohol dehydrogenase family)